MVDVLHVLDVEACNSVSLNVGGVAARVVEARELECVSFLRWIITQE